MNDKLMPILPSNVNMAEYYAMGLVHKAAVEDFATSMNRYFESGIKNMTKQISTTQTYTLDQLKSEVDEYLNN
jgi:hypothetical protein